MILILYSYLKLDLYLFVAAVGCADPNVPKGASYKRDKDKVSVHCNQSAETWFLYCSGNDWIGPWRNCTQSKWSIQLAVNLPIPSSQSFNHTWTFSFECHSALSWAPKGFLFLYRGLENKGEIAAPVSHEAVHIFPSGTVSVISDI